MRGAVGRWRQRMGSTITRLPIAFPSTTPTVGRRAAVLREAIDHTSLSRVIPDDGDVGVHQAEARDRE